MEQFDTIGEKLRSIRKSKKMTLKHVAKQTGLSVSFISEMELCVVDPSLKTLYKLAEFYQTTCADLLQGIM